jgi:hypothetical protein
LAGFTPHEPWLLIKTVPENSASLAMGFSWEKAKVGMKNVLNKQNRNKIFDIFFKEIILPPIFVKFLDHFLGYCFNFFYVLR